MAMEMWLDNHSTTVGSIICRNWTAMFYRLFRKACSHYENTKIRPYLVLPGPVEIDETKLGS